MTYFLSIQNTYDLVEIALWSNEQLIATVQEDKMRASKNFVLLIDSILLDNKLEFKDLSFLAVNQGPGPFTTLRVVISSVNGLNFATQIPLIGIDGLDALLLESSDKNAPVSVAMLNAFNNDVYYCIERAIDTKKGCKNIEAFLVELKNTYPNMPVRFIGNGAQLFIEQIKKYFAEHARIPEVLPSYPSIRQIGLMGWNQWQKKENVSKELMPLYLKQTITPITEPTVKS